MEWPHFAFQATALCTRLRSGGGVNNFLLTNRAIACKKIGEGGRGYASIPFHVARIYYGTRDRRSARDNRGHGAVWCFVVHQVPRLWLGWNLPVCHACECCGAVLSMESIRVGSESSFGLSVWHLAAQRLSKLTCPPLISSGGQFFKQNTSDC